MPTAESKRPHKNCIVTLKHSGVQIVCDCDVNSIQTSIDRGDTSITCPDGTIIMISEIAAVVK